MNLTCRSSDSLMALLLKAVVLILSVAVFLSSSGCVKTVAEKATGASTIKAHSSGLAVEISGAAPVGKYFLKTKDNQIVAVGDVASSNIIRTSMKTHSHLFLKRQGWLPSDVSGGCLHIEKPDGRTLPVGLGRYENFTIPTWKYESLKNHDLLKAKEKLAELKRQIPIKEQTGSWLNRHPALFQNNMCIKLDPGPQPQNACKDMDEVYALYGKYCWESNTGCPLAGGVTRFLGANDVISFALTTGCQFHLDSNNPDWRTFFRSNLITLISHSFYKKFKDGEFGDADKLEADIAAGIVNTLWCLNDYDYHAFSAIIRSRSGIGGVRAAT